MSKRKSSSGLPAAAALAALLSAAIVLPAQACRINLSPEARITAPHNAAALVKITAVTEYTKADTDIQAPWDAKATIIKSAFGDPPSDDVRLGRPGGSAACDDGQRPPKVGDVWVVFFDKNTEGRLVANWGWSYPLEAVRTVDPRFVKF